MALIVILPELMLPNIGDFVFNVEQTFSYSLFFILLGRKLNINPCFMVEVYLQRGIKPLLPTSPFKTCVLLAHTTYLCVSRLSEYEQWLFPLIAVFCEAGA